MPSDVTAPPAQDTRPLPAVGDTAEFTRVVTEAEVTHFAEATGDYNPVHFDEAHARATRFGGRIAHGMLSGGVISAALASRLPGPGTVYLAQSLRFVRPVRLGDAVTARLEVLEVDAAKRRVRLATACVNQHGETVVDGEAVVLVPA